MPFLDVLTTYFRGERAESLAFIVPLGLLSITFGAVLLWDERSAFHWGVAVPFLLLGTALLVTGGAVGLRTPGQMSALSGLYREDVGRFLAEELPRMQKVNGNWPVYLTTWVVFALVGIGLRFFVRRDWAEGLGIALVFFGAVGLLIDGFAERRARPYTEALEGLAKEMGAAPR